MYLKYIQIVNYKNLKNARFKFNRGTNTIIGENDSGKSNSLTAMRILLDSEYYYNVKRLKESDFSHSLGDWRGHWIIISAFFDDISKKDKETEICNELNPDEENLNFLNSYIRSGNNSFGTVTLFIRPIKSVRIRLHNAASDEEFESIRSEIKLQDYEFVYKARTQADFTNAEIYNNIVGNIDKHQYADPDNEDSLITGVDINIINLWQYISVSYIDALRDAETEMKKPRNPIRRIFETIQAEIAKEDIVNIQNKIKELNESLARINEISSIGENINRKLDDIVGLIYSPDVKIESRLREDIDSVSRYLSIVPSEEKDIDQLGLGHLNILYMALKLVEFESNRNHEILNIMMVEEPEAHIHAHIQRTLFDNLGRSEKYTQVLMTTHSTQISEVANIQSVNVLKAGSITSTVMRPTRNLDKYGKDNLGLNGRLSLSQRLERYLDAKRSVLLFSKSVLLVEGDAEEILIPALTKVVFGISLDELGIGVINIGSVSFEYIASVFGRERLQRRCAIITDLDEVVPGAECAKEKAAQLGKSRKDKLMRLYSANPWVKSFFAPHTFEVDFADIPDNRCFYKLLVNECFTNTETINHYCNDIDGNAEKRYDAVIKLVAKIGKGWAATIMADLLDESVVIPDYLLEALAFASLEIMSPMIKQKMMLHVLTHGSQNRDTDSDQNIDLLTNSEEEFVNKYPESAYTKFINYQKNYE
jgi:putative ATP-dependent endonuclease of OLD family